MKYLLLGFLVMFLFTYIGGLFDDAFKELYYTGVWYKDVVGSIKYYVLWILPYSWLIIIIGTVVFGALFYVASIGIDKIKIYTSSSP
jgi:hypothetical protein